VGLIEVAELGGEPADVQVRVTLAPLGGLAQAVARSAIRPATTG
jgi:hypothetical protein